MNMQRRLFILTVLLSFEISVCFDIISTFWFRVFHAETQGTQILTKPAARTSILRFCRSKLRISSDPGKNDSKSDARNQMISSDGPISPPRNDAASYPDLHELKLRKGSIHLPQHIAIIMDGNRRFAKACNMPSEFGHLRGKETLESVVR